jgi:hypothetical protein
VASANKSIETRGAAVRTVVQDQDIREPGLPAGVEEALGELVSDAKAGLLALSVGVSTTLTGRRFVMAMRTARSLSVAGGCRLVVRGRGRWTARRSSF